METCIKVWPWENAPEDYKAICSQGGDEDWIVFVPYELRDILEYGLPTWLIKIDTMEEPVMFDVSDGTLFVGCHS